MTTPTKLLRNYSCVLLTKTSEADFHSCFIMYGVLQNMKHAKMATNICNALKTVTHAVQCCNIYQIPGMASFALNVYGARILNDYGVAACSTNKECCQHLELWRAKPGLHSRQATSPTHSMDLALHRLYPAGQLHDLPAWHMVTQGTPCTEPAPAQTCSNATGDTALWGTCRSHAGCSTRS